MDDSKAADMVAAIRLAFVQASLNGAIQRYFRHGDVCMQVLSGQEDEYVTYKGKRYHCTYGRWMPKALAA